jgi:GNAT superfamily N-acetyltransferase
MSILIRKAEREDFPKLLDLITALAHYEKLSPPDEGAQQRLIEHAWGPKPRYEPWLVEVDGVPAAYAILFETYSSFLAQPTLYLEDIFVLPEYRKRGVGQAVFKRLAQEAVARECGRMEWSCLDWNELALGFYGKLGARQLSEWVYFRLTAEEIAALANSETPG